MSKKIDKKYFSTGERVTYQGIKSLSDEEISVMSREDLQMGVSESFRLAEQRVARETSKMERMGLPTSPAYHEKDRRGRAGWQEYNFEYNSNASDAQLREQLRDMRNFFSRTTTTARGWQKTFQAFMDRVSDVSGETISPEDYEMYWTIYRRLDDMKTFTGTNIGESEKQRQIYNIFIKKRKDSKGRFIDIEDKEKFTEDIINAIETRAQDIYEENAAKKKRKRPRLSLGGRKL